MKNLGKLKTYGYGFFLFSPDKFNGFMKNKKCKAKKYLSYFDKHKDMFFELIKEGIFLPFYRICSFNYEIFTSIDEQNINIPAGYETVYHYKDLYVKTNEKLCFANFDYFEYHKDKIDKNQINYGETIPTGVEETPVWYNYAIGFEIPAGEYLFDIYGLKLTDETEDESNNYGFLFSFKKSNNAQNENIVKCDNDLVNFDIRNIDK